MACVLQPDTALFSGGQAAGCVAPSINGAIKVPNINPAALFMVAVWCTNRTALRPESPEGFAADQAISFWVDFELLTSRERLRIGLV
jgi:hypothetical protein